MRNKNHVDEGLKYTDTRDFEILFYHLMFNDLTGESREFCLILLWSDLWLHFSHHCTSRQTFSMMLGDVPKAVAAR